MTRVLLIPIGLPWRREELPPDAPIADDLVVPQTWPSASERHPDMRCVAYTYSVFRKQYHRCRLVRPITSDGDMCVLHERGMRGEPMRRLRRRKP